MIVKINPDNNKNLLELLQEQNILVPATCGGNGRCGRCRVRVLEGNLPVTKEDKILGAQKCKEGYRLACKAIVTEPLTVEVKVPLGEKILTDILLNTSEIVNAKSEQAKSEQSESDASSAYYIAVDLGTTTVVTALFDAACNLLEKDVFINPQTAFGSDVISRIQAANEGSLQKLKNLIVNAIKTSVMHLLKTKKLTQQEVKCLAIAGNTTMLHLLCGYSCEGMATYPFLPFSLKAEEFNAALVFGDEFEGLEMFLFPGIDAFVGADITAGIYGLDLDETPQRSLLMDLGTNGEMALADSKKLYVTSAAAGPAFEGGSIETGMGCARGAVEHVELKNNAGRLTAECKVVGDTEAEGICGSGAIELLSELIKSYAVEKDGTFTEEFFENGFVYAYNMEGEPLKVTQKDIRELQLAKASVRAASELLLLRASGKAEITAPLIMLAGGLGNGLAAKGLESLKMFPKNSGVVPVGNTCLLGLRKYLMEVSLGRKAKAQARLASIVDKTVVVALAGTPEFNEKFLEYMDF